MQLCKKETERLASIFESHNTMALSTVDERGMPWSCILFFSVDENLSLIYVSKRDAEHSLHIRECPQVSVAIYKDDQVRSQASGLQIFFFFLSIESPQDLKRAKEIYLGQHALIRKMEELYIAFKNMEFYRVHPHFIRLVDNSRGMGFKEEWGDPRQSE